MANQIEFSHLWGVTPEIMEMASRGLSSELSNCRLVSSDWRAHCETLLRALWQQLKDNPPQGVVNILSNMNRIDGEALEGNSAIIGFKKLAHVFQKYGADLPDISLPTRISDFKLLQNEIHDNALRTTWRPLRNALIAAVPNLNLPREDANAHEIREFLNDPIKSAALAQVTMLDLRELNLKVVPPELDRVSGLRTLNLSKNQLSQLPDFDLPNLTMLNLSNNKLSQLPDFAHVQNLTVLNLSNNQLSQVPDFVLPSLTLLYLENNQLSQVPNFAHVQNLTVLNLSNNKLSQVPDFVLPNLTTLSLENNQLSQVPDFVLPSLTTLYLSNNKLSQVPDFDLPNLIWLYLNNNQLSQVPDFDLPSLTTLSLRNNQLSQLPDFVLPSLITLYLENNQLSQLPDFVNMQNLRALSLCGNILMVIPNAVLNRFPISQFARLFNSQLTYQCQSPLASLYQKILANKSSQEQIHAFDALDQKDKNLIFEMVWKIAGKPVGDSQWGEHRAFDEMPRFRIAVQKAIMKKLKRLSHEKRNQVYGEIYHLAGRPLTGDSQWGEHRAKEHPSRLADALSRVN